MRLRAASSFVQVRVCIISINANLSSLRPKRTILSELCTKIHIHSYKNAFQDKVSLVWCCLFVLVSMCWLNLPTGFACVFMFLVSTSVSMGNFRPRHHGLIVGSTGAFFFVGPIIYSIIYDAWFAKLPIGDFFLCLCLSMCVVNTLAILFVRNVPLRPVTPTEGTSLIENAVSFVNEGDSENWCDRLGFTQFVLPSFQLLTWAFLFGGSVQLMYFPNVTIYTTSYTMPSLAVSMPVVGPISGSFVTFAGGLASDRTIRYTSRLTYLIIGTVLQTFVFFISIDHGDNCYVFIITTVVVYSNAGQYWSIFPTLASDYFGMHHFTRNWGLLLMGNALLTLALGYVFALFYDHAILTESTTCIGLQCFSKSYLLTGCLSLLSVVLLITLYVLERRQRVRNASLLKTEGECLQTLNGPQYEQIKWF